LYLEKFIETKEEELTIFIFYDNEPAFNRSAQLIETKWQTITKKVFNLPISWDNLLKLKGERIVVHYIGHGSGTDSQFPKIEDSSDGKYFENIWNNRLHYKSLIMILDCCNMSDGVSYEYQYQKGAKPLELLAEFDGYILLLSADKDHYMYYDPFGITCFTRTFLQISPNKYKDVKMMLHHLSLIYNNNTRSCITPCKCYYLIEEKEQGK